MTLLKGSIAALITPFIDDAEESVDQDKLAELVKLHADSNTWNHDFLASCVITTVALAVLLCLLMAEKIADWLGTTGMNVITRVFGLIILSIAVEFITKGLAAVFPILGQAA